MCEHIDINKANLLDVVVLDVQPSDNLLVLDDLTVCTDTLLRDQHL